MNSTVLPWLVYDTVPSSLRTCLHALEHPDRELQYYGVPAADPRERLGRPQVEPSVARLTLGQRLTQSPQTVDAFADNLRVISSPHHIPHTESDTVRMNGPQGKTVQAEDSKRFGIDEELS